MKLEKDMYVRTKYGISKIENISPNEYDKEHDYVELEYFVFDGLDTQAFFTTDEILKASHNIIDLIEVGDVLIDKEGHKYPINYEFETDYNNEYGSYEITIDDHITLFFKDGLSMVTSQQFSAMEYRLGDK